MNKYLVMVGLVGIAVVFQNCSEKSFSAREDMNKPMSVESEQLVEEEIPDNIKDDVEGVLNEDNDEDGIDDRDVVKEDPKNTGGGHNGGTNVVKDPTTADDGKDTGDDDDGTSIVKEDPKTADGDDDDTNVVEEEPKKVSCKHRSDGNARFVCILAGPGKSTHVAVIDDKIVESNSTPKTACMSEHACENIVGKKLIVKSVEKRGYCKNGTPQVLMFSDADIQRLMDKVQ